MVMRLSRTRHETWLAWKERELVSGRYPGPLWARLIRWGLRECRRAVYAVERWRTSHRSPGSYRDTDLIYAAGSRCDCGAGLAYARNAGMHGEWSCSDVLTGRTAPGDAHGVYPFMFYEIKSEDQPSAQGRTTRPGVKAVRHGAIRRAIFLRSDHEAA